MCGYRDQKRLSGVGGGSHHPNHPELMKDLRYPIGKSALPEAIDDQTIRQWIDTIEAFPEQLRASVEPLDEEQLDTPYRPGGWTLRQVVHHVVDSHINSYVRFKWVLTEDRPTIKAYDQDGWAALADYEKTPVSVSLDLLENLHRRWVILLRSLDDPALDREFVHPDSGPSTLRKMVGLYAWHCQHHLAHVTTTVVREGW